MRIRATVAAVSGALALSAFAVPSAQADDSVSAYRADVAKVRAAHAKSAFGTRADAPYDMDVSFSNFKIAKTVKVGASERVSTTVTYTMTHAADIDIKADDFATGPYIYRGSLAAPDAMLFGNKPATCTATSATAANCTGKIDIYPSEGELVNSDAGAWKGAALALAQNGQDPLGENYDITKVGYAEQGDLGSTLVQRVSRLTVNASPEPVKKGKTITVTGKLTRASWDSNKYVGLPSGQKVTLQFRKAGTSAYTNVKGIKTTTDGALKTTVTAVEDGYYRFTYAGITSTAPVSAKGDAIDVQ
ncbi:hypothetical protein STRCI_003733 [Streptomyces cinnabarinus]|uniref:Lipoprotein n=1 Tax=Streptomyces cinnabarinus TaxID=67287 RepID=A0ABY7KEH6_9ACTN|nr:hypothetical protein [Streptomyces cinnabarinus]WAZ22478.1 hypothetical protein STRCI_003733 [Streptomyces cinnabarinus]